MSELTPEDTPTTPPSRRSVEVALARMEAKLDVAIAQHQARLDEHSRRIAENTQALASHEKRITHVEVKQERADAREQERSDAKTPPQPWTTYVSLGIALLLALYVVLNNYAGNVSP